MRSARSRQHLTAIAVVVSVLVHGLGIAGLAVLVGVQRAMDAVRNVSPTPPPISIVPAETFGTGEGTGDANSTSVADGVQQGPRIAMDQAGLTESAPGIAADSTPPPPPAVPAAEALADLSQPRAFRPPAQELARLPAPIGPRARTAPQAVDGEPEPAPEPPPASEAADAQRPPSPSASSPATPPAGRPLEASDRELDPFASEVAVVFQRGRLTARQGREFKLARLGLNLAAFAQAHTLSFPALIRMLVEIDGKGHVQQVRVLRSTGSTSIDREVELTMYSSWFEPGVDAQGRVKPRDSFEFAIGIH